jgi:hypothetical protein
MCPWNERSISHGARLIISGTPRLIAARVDGRTARAGHNGL